MREAREPVRITVTGYVVTSPGFDDDELTEAAERIAEDIGMALCSLGTSCVGGAVSVECDGAQAVAGEVAA